MKTSLIALLPALLLAQSATAADPGGWPGLLKAVFTGSAFDTTSSVMDNCCGRTLNPEEMYDTSLPEKTTVAWAGYMKMTGGVTYNFKGCYDDYVSVKISGTWVLSQGSECKERTGNYKPSATDWYPIEFRVANNGGPGGCQSSSQYGILWKTSSATTWNRVEDPGDGSLFKTGISSWSQVATTHALPIILSSQIRANDPTVMDITYVVLSPSATVNVRALAFEDGERSFAKVIRPETFIEGTDANLGDGIAANVEHRLSWKVAADWDIDLAHVKFEILTSDMGVLPLDLETAPAVNGQGALTYSTNTQTESDVFNALLWHYADGDADLSLVNGYLRYNGLDIAVYTGVTSYPLAEHFLYRKMGYDGILSMKALEYVSGIRRAELTSSTVRQYAYQQDGVKGWKTIGPNAYCVIDLSGGPNAASYPVSYLDSEPNLGWSDEYKTTKLLLRRIEPGTYLMQGNRPVTLTKAFYIGVFEVTQKQYQLVTGSDPSAYKGDMRPVETVSWNTVRGGSWPSPTTVGTGSFVAKIRQRTGLSFDLPTEAQWEYACRAGTTSDPDAAYYVRSSSNVGKGDGFYVGGSTTVGSFRPNAWGLYDMLGNVCEWVLDGTGDLGVESATDPVGSSSGSYRVLRGGGWYSSGSYCSSSGRRNGTPSNPGSDYGFRLSRTLP